MIDQYYVYAYLREDDTPYYIGKGKGLRYKKPHSYRSKYGIYVPDDINRISFIKENISESEAHQLEIDLIRHYGRKDIGTGILRNLTNGGEGKSGWNPSTETRLKFSSAFFKVQMNLLDSGIANFSPNNNPNKIRVSCIVCKKETSLPSLKNHRQCRGENKFQNTKYIQENNPSKIRISCVKCHKETGISGFSQHFKTHFSKTVD